MPPEQALTMHDAMRFALSVLTVVSGLTSAWYWWKSSQVNIVPRWGGGVESGDSELSQQVWLAALLVSSTEAARLNKLAALWSAASVLLAAISWIIGGSA